MVQPLLTEEEKVKVRHHLGYLNVGAAQTFVLGVPAGVETQFMIEGAMDRVNPAALGEVRRILAVLSQLEDQAIGDAELLMVSKVGSIDIRPDELKRVWEQYLIHRDALANLLGTYPNPFDRRFSGGAAGGINTTVNHG